MAAIRQCPKVTLRLIAAAERRRSPFHSLSHLH